jgi:hypothetical protein
MNRKLAAGVAALTLMAATGCNELQIQSVNIYSTGVKVTAVEVGPGTTGTNSFHAWAQCLTPPGALYSRIGPEASTVDGVGSQGGGVFVSWAYCGPGDVTTTGGYAGRFR